MMTISNRNVGFNKDRKYAFKQNRIPQFCQAWEALRFLNMWHEYWAIKGITYAEVRSFLSVGSKSKN